MENFDKLLYNNVDFILFFAILEAIIIVFLSYNIKRKKKGGNIQMREESLSEILEKKDKMIEYWRKGYNDLNNKLAELKGKSGVNLKRENSYSRPESNNWNFKSRENQEDKNQFFDKHNNFDTEGSGAHIEQTINDDENQTTNIYFDLTNDNHTAETASNNRKYEYLEPANNGQFRKLLPSDEKSFFRTWEEGGVRMFEFHGNVERALANINAIFDDVCEIEGKQNGATQIDNIAPGTLTSKLEVDKPAKIRLS